MDSFAQLLHHEIALRNLALPMGLSFFTFKAISYLADIYTQKIKEAQNPVNVALYLSFFAQIQSGPLSRYSEMFQDNIPLYKQQKFDLFCHGVYRFMNGFNKKILLSNILANITQETFSASSSEMSLAYAWLGALCYAMQLYFDFSGYSDMAIGVTEMFGFHCSENFSYPYTTTSIAMFWRKWHITLGSWFRDYVYIPLGGSRVKSHFRLYLNLLAVWLFTGIWHGASWNFILWGLGYFILIAFEKTTGFPGKLKSTVSSTIYRIFTLLFILFQWVLFRAENFHSALVYFKKMLIYSPNALADARTLFLIKDNLGFIIAGILFCFPVLPHIEQKLSNYKTGEAIYEIITSITRIALFIWAISFVVSGQNNPFAYANF